MYRAWTMIVACGADMCLTIAHRPHHVGNNRFRVTDLVVPSAQREAIGRYDVLPGLHYRFLLGIRSDSTLSKVPHEENGDHAGEVTSAMSILIQVRWTHDEDYRCEFIFCAVRLNMATDDMKRTRL